MSAKHFVNKADLARPAVTVTAEIAQRYLEQANQACERLQAKEDAEALHDLRVALRQLRSTLQAYPDCLLQVTRKQQKKLKHLARVTNPARDTEVQLAYLQDWLGGMLPEQRPGGQWLQQQLRRREAQAYAHSHKVLKARFERLYRRLNRQLASVPEIESPIAFGPRLAQELRTAGEVFRQRLEQLAVHEGDADLHAARIAGKRVRYLITPLSKRLGQVAAVLSDLKAIQDLLGEYHDMMVFEDTLLEYAPAAATDSACMRLRGIAQGDAPPAPGSDLLPGLYHLGELMAQRKQALARQVLAHETAGDDRELFVRLNRLIQAASDLPAQP